MRCFTKKELQETNQTEFRVEKVIKIIYLMTGYIRKILLYNMSYLAEP